MSKIILKNSAFSDLLSKKYEFNPLMMSDYEAKIYLTYLLFNIQLNTVINMENLTLLTCVRDNHLIYANKELIDTYDNNDLLYNESAFDPNNLNFNKEAELSVFYERSKRGLVKNFMHILEKLINHDATIFNDILFSDKIIGLTIINNSNFDNIIKTIDYPLSSYDDKYYNIDTDWFICINHKNPLLSNSNFFSDKYYEHNNLNQNINNIENSIKDNYYESEDENEDESEDQSEYITQDINDIYNYESDYLDKINKCLWNKNRGVYTLFNYNGINYIDLLTAFWETKVDKFGIHSEHNVIVTDIKLSKTRSRYHLTVYISFLI